MFDALQDSLRLRNGHCECNVRFFANYAGASWEGRWWWVRVLPLTGTLIWRFPGFIRPRCTAGATHKAAESYQGIEVHVPYSLFTFRFIVSRGTNFKTEHLAVVWSRMLFRARLFLPDE